MSDVENDARDSKDAFRDLVAPVIESWKEGDVRNVENVTESDVADKLDTVAGVDAWCFETEKRIEGIGSRCQKAGPFDTFTVRKERSTNTPTEFEKRLYQINNGCLHCHYTVQAYYDANNWVLQSAAICRTEELIKFIQHGVEGDAKTWRKSERPGEGDYWVNQVPPNPNPGQKWEKFYCVDWDYYQTQGYGVQITKPYKEPDDKIAPRSQKGLADFV